MIEKQNSALFKIPEDTFHLVPGAGPSLERFCQLSRTKVVDRRTERAHCGLFTQQ